jgi:inorganic pyrophosphatase
MPLGTLQKFEVTPHLPQNAIQEDEKGSKRLQAFGRPVPFNYGCFPQTYRDPNQTDKFFNAPGDDDPLDVLDLGDNVVGVGEVVRCRPLGAVCLIDEGQADWKILAVNVDEMGPLRDALSVEDVDRIMPGRVQACLKWMDDFKKSSGKGEATLHFQIHGPEQAIRLIEQDHAAWTALCEEAGPDGIARGHWIHAPRAAKPAVVKHLGWKMETVAETPEGQCAVIAQKAKPKPS